MSNEKTRENSQKSISLKTATRIRVIVLSWMKEVEAEEEAAIQIADNVASNTFLWLSSIRQDSDRAETAKNLLKELLLDNLSDEQVQEIRDHVSEAIEAIKALYADDDSEQKARAEREKARFEEMARQREKARQEREEKRKRAEEEKARKTAEAKARKARAKSAQDSIHNFRPQDYTQISFLDCKPGDFITFASVEGYSDTYQIMDLSKTALYVVNGFDSAGRAQYISVELSQFEYTESGETTFTDMYDSSNVANVKCYRKAG